MSKVEVSIGLMNVLNLSLPQPNVPRRKCRTSTGNGLVTTFSPICCSLEVTDLHMVGIEEAGGGLCLNSVGSNFRLVTARLCDTLSAGELLRLLGVGKRAISVRLPTPPSAAAGKHDSRNKVPAILEDGTIFYYCCSIGLRDRLVQLVHPSCNQLPQRASCKIWSLLLSCATRIPDRKQADAERRRSQGCRSPPRLLNQRPLDSGVPLWNRSSSVLWHSGP